MAVYAAHLTRTLQGTPSVFQVTAQEALGATVKPALRKLVEYLSSAYPNKLSWSEQWFDEVYLVFDACLQYHYLKHYAASFSESFYGLIRVPTSMSEFSSGQRLPPGVERASLALLVLAPYLRDKLEAVVERWREDEEDGKLGKSVSGRARAAAIRVYSVGHLTYSLGRLYQLAAYMRGTAASHCPQLRALAVGLRDAPPRDPVHWGGVLGGDVQALSFPLVGKVLLSCVEYGAFLVQFLRWWESRHLTGAGVGVGSSLPTPDPPEKDEKAMKYRNKCPICMQAWKVPTVLPVSGYIYCYVCISREVRARGRCPVTGWPAQGDSLLRLYI